MDYPLAWDNGDSYLGQTIFTTAADCCAVIEASGRSCEVIDECDVVAQDTMNVMKHTTTYKGQCGNKWHLDIEKPWGCSNSKDFPDDWWLEEAVERMLHDTAESCCNEMFGSPDCDLFDECDEKVNTPVVNQHGIMIQTTIIAQMIEIIPWCGKILKLGTPYSTRQKKNAARRIQPALFMTSATNGLK